MRARVFGVVLVVAAMCGAGTALATEPESKRLARAKDLIAEEQWMRAVDELRAAEKDPKESRRDEVMYWLAHSLNQAGNASSALTTIAQLERSHPSSLWVKPAQSLRLEIAMRLGRIDVLWRTALAPPPPPPPVPPAHLPPPPARAPARPAPPAQPAPHVPPAPPAPAVAPPAPAPPIVAWIPDNYHPDPELRIQALGLLIHTDADKVIPVLKEMVFKAESPGVASRAVFLLAQSQRPDARSTVVQAAHSGPAPVRVVAVRELARFGGPEATRELMQVYTIGDVNVKRQVVRSLGERWEKTSLLTIARSETDHDLKAHAIMSLGLAGGVTELRQLYARMPSDAKRPIILSLFSARAEDELIQIAERETDRVLKEQILSHLRWLGTPKAKQYLQKVGRQKP